MRPTGPKRGRRTSRSSGSDAGSSSGRPGVATAARRTTSSSPSIREWRSGRDSTRRPASALRGSSRSPTGARSTAPASSTSAAAPGSSRSPRSSWARATPWGSTPTRSRSRQRRRMPPATARRARIEAREGSLPSGERPFDVVLANLIASVARRSRAVAPRRGRARRRRSWHPGSSSTASPKSASRSRRVGLDVGARSAEGEWVALEAVRR